MSRFEARLSETGNRYWNQRRGRCPSCLGHRMSDVARALWFSLADRAEVRSSTKRAVLGTAWDVRSGFLRASCAARSEVDSEEAVVSRQDLRNETATLETRTLHLMEFPGFETVSTEVAAQLIHDAERDFLKICLPAGHEAYKNALICRGDWRGRALTIPKSTLMVVGGDLHVDTWLCTEHESYSSQSISEFVVMGNVVVRDMVIVEEMTIDGNLKVERLLLADSAGDLTLHVDGDLSAGHLAAAGHHLRVTGATTARAFPQPADIADIRNQIRQNLSPIP